MPKKKSDKSNVEDLQQQVAELTDALQRERADAENVRRRAGEDRVEALVRGKEMAAEELIPLIDNLIRAFEHTPDDIKDHSWVKGVLGINKQLDILLKDFGLKKIDTTTGTEFDAETMEAVGVEEGGDGTDRVSAELQAGFKLNGRVVRVAMVKVKR
ncbi:MAG: nucleotide exchange factor GrpE [Patescibacteria group bacterium]